MPTLTQEDVFTFDQLSDRAKERARDEEREGFEFDTYDLFHTFHDAGNILGISFANAERRGRVHEAQYIYAPDIRYSGFCSQGDGASFVGSYSCAPGASGRIRKEFPTETALHEIADSLTAIQVGCRLSCGKFMQASITQQGRYVHSHTMDIETPGDDEDAEFDANREMKLLELMRNFADWIYKSLEQEYDDQRSDEYIDVCLSDCQFYEDGERV
jgi:hypothetical protein